MYRKVDVIRDLEGRTVVVLHDLRFKGRQNINWDEVEQYVKEFVGECYEVAAYADKIFIGVDFPEEFGGSNDSARLKGTLAKAKANAAQGLPQLIEVATNKRFQENMKMKHAKDAKFGWYRYTTNFALPVYDSEGQLERYNVFRIEMLVRHAEDGKLYLYDLVNIKKRNEHPKDCQ